MNVQQWNQLGITPDTDDPVDLSLAIASRGVLEAKANDAGLLTEPERWGQSLAGTMAASTFVPWHRPGSAHPLQDMPLLSAAALAQAWQGGVAQNAGKQVRIAAASVQGGLPSAAAAVMIGIALTSHGQQDEAPGIAPVSAFTQADLSPTGLQNWPLWLGILPGAGADHLAGTLQAGSMFKRGLARVRILSKREPGCDILIVPFPLRELRRHALSHDFIPIASAVLGSQVGLQNTAQRRVLLERLRRDMGASVVVAGIPLAGLEGVYVNELVRTLAHRQPLDVALWHADRHIRTLLSAREARQMRAPTIFANADAISRSPIDVQVDNIEQRLGRIDGVSSPDSAISMQLRQAGLAQGVLGAIDIANSLKAMTFDEERGGASVVAAVAAVVAASESNTFAMAVRPALYGDVTLVDARDDRRVDDQREPLVSGRDYTLEVALRQQPSGISPRQGLPQAVAPLPGGEELRLLVVVHGDDADFRIDHPTQWLTIASQADQDSSIASFSICPLRSTPGKHGLCTLEVRIYYELVLLEVMVVQAAVTQQYGSLPDELKAGPPIFMEQPVQIERGYLDLGRWQTPRALGIDVSRDGDMARFTFIVKRRQAPAEEDMFLRGRLDIALSRLVPELIRMRELWEEVALNLIGASLRPDERVFKKVLLRLAQAGRDLWSLLFRGSMHSSMHAIGQWLWAHPLPAGAVLDVRLLQGASEFAFPWSLLYDRELPSGAAEADPEGFWGVRYCIGQAAMDWRQGDEPIVASPTSRIEFMLWGAFPNGREHTALLEKIEAASNRRLALQPPIITEQAFSAMMADCDADLLYFYTHGYTRPAGADAGYNPVHRIRERFEQLGPVAREASGLQALYDMITAQDFKPDESWIALSMGRLWLRHLRAIPVNLRRSPVVFLNMCQSAQVMPGLADSFATYFLDRKARSVLGTECPMTTVFAHAFAEKVLGEFFSGKSLGESLRSARQYFMAHHNPLGLAYTLFGAATVRYEPAPI